MKFEWELIYIKDQDKVVNVTARAKVIGGWIIRNGCAITISNSSISESMVFIPDPNHEWSIK